MSYLSNLKASALIPFHPVRTGQARRSILQHSRAPPNSGPLCPYSLVTRLLINLQKKLEDLLLAYGCGIRGHIHCIPGGIKGNSL